jgi:hypothetical protein
MVLFAKDNDLFKNDGMSKYSSINWAGWLSGNALDLFVGAVRFEYRPRHQLAWGFRPFPQSFEAKARIVSGLWHDHFSTSPFQFPTHLWAPYWRRL